ncbi:MAG: hypothetical protein ABIU29_07975 [Chthoniobacterales bacterium]
MAVQNHDLAAEAAQSLRDGEGVPARFQHQDVVWLGLARGPTLQFF